MDVRNWLKDLGLERYAEAFEENELELADLADLTVDDLKDDLGVKRLPDRKKMLKAIAALSDDGPATVATPVPEDPTVPDRGPTPDPLPPPAEAAPEKPARTLGGRSRRPPRGDPYEGSILGGLGDLVGDR